MRKNKLTFTWKVIIIFSFVLSLFSTFYSKYDTKYITKIVNNYNVKDTLYDYTLEDIRKNEGLKLKLYRCPSNQLTIGYGHSVLKHEKFINFDSLQAEILLRYDFEKCYRLTDTSLKYNQRLAIAHFIYGLGYTKYNKSSLKQDIKNNKYIANSLLQYIKYKHKGTYKSSKNLYNARLFELNLYYK
jgi:GH24 family phage-related lysozyme (muramidase)